MFAVERSRHLATITTNQNKEDRELRRKKKERQIDRYKNV